MKRNSLLFAFIALLGICTFALTSCSDDDDEKPDASQPIITLSEVGEENSKEAVAGSDLHLEGDLLAENLIKSIDIEVHQEGGGSFEFGASYTEGKYIGVKNAHFHEHLEVPADAPAGEYHLHFTLTDQKGFTATFESDLHITVPAEGAPEIALTAVGEGDSKQGVAGQEMHVVAQVKASKNIAKIVVEFHKADGKYEKEFTFDSDKYVGKAEADFNEQIMVPADAPAGEYHVHFTVTDAAGNSTTAEAEGVQIKAKA